MMFYLSRNQSLQFNILCLAGFGGSKPKSFKYKNIFKSLQSKLYLHVALDDIFPDGRIVDIGVNDGE